MNHTTDVVLAHRKDETEWTSKRSGGDMERGGRYKMDVETVKWVSLGKASLSPFNLPPS
jgi:hypothetical protein